MKKIISWLDKVVLLVTICAMLTAVYVVYFFESIYLWFSDCCISGPTRGEKHKWKRIYPEQEEIIPASFVTLECEKCAAGFCYDYHNPFLTGNSGGL